MSLPRARPSPRPLEAAAWQLAASAPCDEAGDKAWEDAVHTRAYITGAHGSRHRDEAYGSPYELPRTARTQRRARRSPAIHCAWRLLLATGEARYADEMERALYDAVAVAVSGDGTAFFYSNPLQVRTGHAGGGEEASTRRLPWYSWRAARPTSPGCSPRFRLPGDGR